MRIGDKLLCLHTLSDTEDLPAKVSTDNRYERLSTDRSDCRLSFASPVGLLLPCNHIYNQYLLIDDPDENLTRFEKTARNMNSLSKYSRSNAINKEWIDQYLNEAHSYGLISVRCHCNIMAWSDDAEELRRVKMMLAVNWRQWVVCHGTTLLTARHCFGLRCPAMRLTSLRRNHSIHSSNLPFASSLPKQTTVLLSLHSG